MSADNYAVVAQHPDTGRWHVLHGFASEDEFVPHVNRYHAEVYQLATPTVTPAMLRAVHEAKHATTNPGRWAEKAEHLLSAIADDYFEYGYSQGEWPYRWTEPTECPTCGDCTLWVERTRVNPPRK